MWAVLCHFDNCTLQIASLHKNNNNTKTVEEDIVRIHIAAVYVE